jgi:hypothetical protein
MGFSKSKVQTEIPINFSVDVVADGVELDRATVTHVFRRPTIKEREFYRQVAHRWEGGKPKLRLTKANLSLWETCILRVEGYDDLPKADFKNYFLSDDIGQAHADAAARILMEKIAEVEESLEKNSD